MKYTFEITISGCATSCGHCYVDGGPASVMKTDDVLYCIRRAAKALSGLGGEKYITFGNEIFCHRDVGAIYVHMHDHYPEFFTERETVPTTGIALLHRPDREAVLVNMCAAGVRQFEMTLHGFAKAHDAVVQRKGAFDALIESAYLMRKRGFRLAFNLMVSNSLIADFDDVMDILENFDDSEISLTVPLYAPTKRMRMYQSNRAGKTQCLRLADMAEHRGLDAAHLRACAERYSESAVRQFINEGKWDYSSQKRSAPDWKFFNVNQRLNVFEGNVGMHTQLYGNLRDMTDDFLCEALKGAAPNYDYTAFWPDEAFEKLKDFVHEIPACPGNFVYPSSADCIYAMLDASGRENLLI